MVTRGGFLDQLAAKMSDDDLITLMVSKNENAALLARQLWDRKHAGDPPPAEPPHCDECFEGCPKCQP